MNQHFSWPNVLERMAWTFLETFISLLVVVDYLFAVDIGVLEQATSAAAASSLVVLKEVAKARLAALAPPVGYDDGHGD